MQLDWAGHCIKGNGIKSHHNNSQASWDVICKGPDVCFPTKDSTESCWRVWTTFNGAYNASSINCFPPRANSAANTAYLCAKHLLSESSHHCPVTAESQEHARAKVTRVLLYESQMAGISVEIWWSKYGWLHTTNFLGFLGVCSFMDRMRASWSVSSSVPSCCCSFSFVCLSHFLWCWLDLLLTNWQVSMYEWRLWKQCSPHVSVWKL